MLFVYTTSTVTFSLSSSCTVYTPRPLLLDRTLLARRDTHPHPCRLVRDRDVLLLKYDANNQVRAVSKQRASSRILPPRPLHCTPPLPLDRTLLARLDTDPRLWRLVRDCDVLLIELRPHQNLFAAATRRYS